VMLLIDFLRFMKKKLKTFLFSLSIFINLFSFNKEDFWKIYREWKKIPEIKKEFLEKWNKGERDLELAKILGMISYEEGDYTEAKRFFESFKSDDNEYLFYYARTLEKLNLFTEAIEVYSKIKEGRYSEEAKKRIDEIEASKKSYSYEILPEVIKKLIKESQNLEKDVQAGAIVLIDSGTYRIFSDSTSILDIHFAVKILNDRGKRRFAEMELPYDSTDEVVEIIYARTIKPEEKKVIPVGRKHIRDVSKYLNFPLYSNARVKIISFPEVEEGSVLEYRARYKISKLIDDRFTVFTFSVQGNFPYMKQYFEIIFPESLNIDYKDYRRGYLEKDLSLKPEVKKEGKNFKYIWKIDYIPEIIKEENMPPLAEIVDYVRISNFKTWENIYEWWKKLYEEKIETDENIRKKVKDLIKGVKKEREKAERIYSWVCENIRYVAVEYGEAGFRPHTASEIFLNKYGDCKDQAILLISMLRYAGIKAYPVLIGTVGTYPLDENFPSLYFNHAIALCEVEEEEVFLDPTGETVSFGDLPSGDQGRKVLVFKDDNFEIKETPLIEPEFNKVFKKMEIVVKKDESIKGERIVITDGVFNAGQRWYFKYTKKKQIEETLKRKINSITPGGKLLKWSVEGMDELKNNIVLKMSFEGKKYFSKAGILRIVPDWGGLDSGLCSLEERNYPLYFRFLSENEYEIDIELPKNYSVFYLPKKIEIDNRWFYFLREYKFKNKTLKLHQISRWKKRVIDVNEYKEFRKVFNDILQKIEDKAVLKVDK